MHPDLVLRNLALRLAQLHRRADRLHSYGLYTCGLYSYDLCSYGLYSYGLYSYGLYPAAEKCLGMEISLGMPRIVVLIAPLL